MQRKTVFLLCGSVLCGTLLLSGCMGADTSDPRKGGLFGYSPSNYEARLQDRQRRLDEINEDTERAREQTEALEKTRKAKEARLNAQRKKLSQDLGSVSGKVEKARRNPKADPERVRRLETRRQAVQKESRSLSEMSDAEKEAKIREMRRELHDLEAEADALSRM